MSQTENNAMTPNYLHNTSSITLYYSVLMNSTIIVCNYNRLVSVHDAIQTTRIFISQFCTENNVINSLNELSFKAPSWNICSFETIVSVLVQNLFINVCNYLNKCIILFIMFNIAL